MAISAPGSHTDNNSLTNRVENHSSPTWKFVILLALKFGSKLRFKELQRNIPGITGKVIPELRNWGIEHRRQVIG